MSVSLLQWIKVTRTYLYMYSNGNICKIMINCTSLIAYIKSFISNVIQKTFIIREREG